MERPRYTIAAVERALNVLDCFTVERSELTLTEISELLEEQKGTVFRFLTTLGYLGYLDVDPFTRRYRLGRKVLSLGQVALQSLDLRQRALPVLRKLSDEVNENVNLSILEGGEIVYLERIVSRQFLSMTLRIGSRLPVYCSSMGKVLVACLPVEERNRVVNSLDFHVFTPRTISDRSRFLAELDHVTEQGYAVSDGELAEGLITVAAPIWGWDRQVKAAVNISAPTARLNAARILELLPALLAAAHAISDSLGASR